VIIRKLQYFRDGGSEKHIPDVNKMLGSDSVRIDYKILNEFIGIYSLKSEMEKVKKFRTVL